MNTTKKHKKICKKIKNKKTKKDKKKKEQKNPTKNTKKWGLPKKIWKFSNKMKGKKAQIKTTNNKRIKKKQ